jgi:putative dimethyl sulfoxide reductase chaperone
MDEAIFDAAAALLLKRPDLELVSQSTVFFGFKPSEGETEQALQDWNDLFFVPSSGRYMLPLESVFREGRVGGHLAADANTAYQAAGFEPGALDMDPLWRSALHPDHLGVELAFVSALLRGAARSPETEAGLMASAKVFHRAHVASWAAGYGRQMSQRAQSSLYRHLGHLLEELAGWTH